MKQISPEILNLVGMVAGDKEIIAAVAIGIGLSASCGFRNKLFSARKKAQI